MVRSRSAPTDTTAWQQFENDEAKARFQNFKNRKLFFELGFIFTKETDGGFGPDVMDIMTPLKWQKFARHPGSVNASLVKEFYANIFKPNQYSIFVRGKKIRFTSTAINHYFHLQDVVDNHATFEEEADSNKYDGVLEDLCFENTEWNGRQTSRYSVNRERLQPRAKLWNHFLKNKLMPTSHNTTVSLSRLLLLHSIMVSRPIDVGCIIVQQVHDCLGKKASALVFPNLITTLCRKKKVEENAFDEILPGLSGINRARLTLLLGIENPKSNDPVHEQSAGATESNAEARLLALEEAVTRTQAQIHALHGDIHEILPAFNAEASPEPEHDAPDPPADDPTPDTHRSKTPEYPSTVPVEETPSPVPAPNPSPAQCSGHRTKTTAGRIAHYYSNSSESIPAPIRKRTRRGATSTSKAPPPPLRTMLPLSLGEKKTKRYFCIRTAGTGHLSLHVKDCCNRLPELPMDHCHLEDKYSQHATATLIHCDEFRDHLPTDTTVKCLADACFFLDEPDILGNRTISDFYHDVVQLQSVTKSLNKKCARAMEPSKASFRSSLLKALSKLEKDKERGMFINSCFVHCQTWMAETWHSPNSPRINNKTIAESVGDWYFNRKPSKKIDCPYPCNPTCHNMITPG
ncbi:hypothetical protein F3Y22_tig00116939pilonHSYRG00213 [Hibiscus syriacus]|uniref:Putative plant transposon protein domain-containing protein n=1 Tax=Hibiscus syriacus TaxID=106335 RepID=A0A6A2WM54_HIBSY|nr:hypothetical protein F3Y22_tig00116939pilonHSYRG00213 [Hibiscus syriacus]